MSTARLWQSKCNNNIFFSCNAKSVVVQAIFFVVDTSIYCIAHVVVRICDQWKID